MTRWHFPVGIRDYLVRFVGSRKWLLTVAVSVVLIRAAEWPSLVSVVLGYLAVQGGSDLLTSWAGARANPDALTPQLPQPPELPPIAQEVGE